MGVSESIDLMQSLTQLNGQKTRYYTAKLSGKKHCSLIVPDSSAWAEKRETSTQCLCMLCSPRISGKWDTLVLNQLGYVKTP